VSKSFFFAVALFLTPELMAQSSDVEPAARVDQIQAQRISKAAHVRPDKPSTVEKTFTRVEDILQGGPIRLGVAGLGRGAGLSASSLFEWSTFRDRLRPKLWGSATVHRFYTAGTGVVLPHIGDRNVSIALEGSHSDAPQLEYYGTGPDSLKSNRTDYRLEDTLIESRLNFSPHRNLSSTCRVGQVFLNVGPGTSTSLASTETVFGPAEAPGIDVQSNYLIGGCFAEIDLRDFPNDPHDGTFAGAGYDRYQAEEVDRFSFNRVYAEAEQYIPFLNRKRVIALRARTVLSWHAPDQVVPFYLQTMLGSDRTLRGFRRYRFHDENSILLSGEYRWQVSTGFDMALFADAGKVFHQPSEISLTDLQTDAGFGLRFKGVRGLALQLDTGFSREGWALWLRFGKIF
jgi:hypothetical protein